MCNILKGNLVAEQNITKTISFYTSLKIDLNGSLGH